MKVAIISFNGSAGKTITGVHLFKPRMPMAKFFAIESTNQSASDLGLADVETLRGRDVGDLIELLLLEDDAIIDIGASNIETFFEGISRFHGAIDDIDKFVIPVTAEAKSWQEGLKTVEALAAIGIPADKIYLLPNRITSDPQSEIPGAYAYVKKTKKATISADAFLYESDVYGYLSHHKLAFDELIDESADYKALARAETDPEKRKEYANKYRWTSEAIPVRKNLDACFDSLTR